jgi:hypothetical protein
MTNALVVRTLDGCQVRQRQSDGYVNATELCKVAGKLFADYRRLDAVNEYLVELSAIMGIPIIEIVQSKQGRPENGGGTWVHPDVAINLAQWCSPRFAVQVSQWVRELISTGSVNLSTAAAGWAPTTPRLPPLA